MARALPQLVPFKAEHTLHMRYRDGDRVESVESALAKETEGPGFTALLDGRVLGAGGIAFLWPGVASAWTVLTEELMQNHAIWATRHIRRCIRDWFHCFELHRLEAVVLADNALNIRWLEMLGFVCEGGVARAYTHDRRDVLRYELTLAGTITLRVAHPEETMDGFRTIVALDRGAIVGRASYGVTSDGYAYGHNVEVSEAYRSHGLGQRLHKLRLYDAHKRGAQWFVGFTNDVSMASILIKNNGTPTIRDASGVAYVTPLRTGAY